jgi:hypothetical protein
VDLGFAKVAVLTSKDAWMPDMVDRLAALGADMIIQPEAFSGWGIEEMPGDWLPDVVLQSGWSAVQKHGAYRYAVIPHLTGNLFDQVFDGQSAILADAVPGDAIQAYVGQPPEGGFVAVAPWVAEDPADPALSLEDRRSILRAAGAALVPGGSNENGYIETVIAADIKIDKNTKMPDEPGGEPGALGPSSLVAESPLGEQTAPAAASDGSTIAVLAWEDDRGGVPQIYLARSTDGGATFGVAAPVALSTDTQLTPSVLVTKTTVYVAFQSRTTALGARILVARSTDGGQTFEAPIPVTTLGPGSDKKLDEWKPALAEGPSGAVFLAFVSGDTGNERVLCARSTTGGATWQITAADGEPPAFAGLNIRNNQWAPAIAIEPNGDVAVAWTDFRTYNWDIVLARSIDGGQSFGPASRIDDGTDARERIHSDPALLASGGPLVAAWTDVRLRKPFAKARVALASSNAIEPSLPLGAAPDAAPTYRPRLAATGAGAVVAVWQDFRARSNDIYLAVSADAGASFGPERRIDDGGPSDQLAPAIAALPGGAILVAWEDARAGARRIRFVTGQP